MPNALILGISGQTGSYLASNLLDRGYQVSGLARLSTTTGTHRLEKLGIREDVKLIYSSYEPEDLKKAVSKAGVETVFALSGPSSVAGSFSDAPGYFSSILQPQTELLNFIAEDEPGIKIVNSGSTDSYGFQRGKKISEDFPFSPASPYGFAKATSVELVRFYRREFGISASNAILTNHESCLRDSHFLTARISSELEDVSQGLKEVATFGNLEVVRDWLWAGDVAEALVSIAEAPEPSDYIVASGRSVSARYLVDLAWSTLGNSTRIPIAEADDLKRPNDVPSVFLNPTKIQTELFWKASVQVEQLIEMILERQLFPSE